jgi:hypothetical protein
LLHKDVILEDAVEVSTLDVNLPGRPTVPSSNTENGAEGLELDYW